MRKIMWYVLMVLALPIAVTAQPNAGNWEAMLYDYNSGLVYVVNSNSTQSQLALPSPPEYGQRIPRYVAASPDGTRLVYIVYEQPRGNGGVAAGAGGAQLLVYNRETEALDQYPFVNINAHSLEYAASAAIFSPDGNQIALGYLQPDGWYIAILNLNTRRYSDAVLSSIGTQLTGAPATYERPLPVVTRFDGQNVEFVVVPSETPQVPNALNSYVWNTQDNTVEGTVRFSSLDYDLLPATAEVVEANLTEAFPTNPAFGLGHNNVINIAADYNNRVPIYAAQTTNQFRPHFVLDGEAVLFQTIDTASNTIWRATYRNTDVTTAPLSGLGNAVRDLTGTPNGVLLTADAIPAAEVLGLQTQGGISLIHADMRSSGAAQLDLIGSFNAPDLTLIWLNPVRAGAAPVLTPWASIDSGGGGAIPTPPAELVVNGQATVFTTEGDALNIRSAPGTNFSVVARLTPGDTVTLLEGPTQAAGLTWWRVRTAAGVEGWAVESADGVRTLQAVGTVAATPIPTPTTAPDGIFVGGRASVIVGAGGAVNMREQASTQTRVVLILRDGETLNVIGGPIQTEGYTWWQVQPTDRAITGWVVEAVDGEAVIAPAS